MPDDGIPEDVSGTKRALIEAAGELFATHGLEGVSIRMIAEKASANVAAINYYFGSKENLYYEALKFVARMSDDRPVQSYLAELGEEEDPAKAQAVLDRLIRDKVRVCLAGGEPDWHMRLIMRALMDPTPQLRQLVEGLFRPDFMAMRGLLVRCRPGMDENETTWVTFAVMGMIFFYVTERIPILMLLNKEGFDASFIQGVSDVIVGMVLQFLRDFSTEHGSCRGTQGDA
ncbi:MAG TPA: CerR family C-terminal domain-containing protein [Candidatus Hydrogenedentes bacterium]|nr:CerR family C-terminal domain-containing protein [Candidatus Hydrogenedentota bacterium]HOV61979.1 CerR family C-terminal domain-containing protein [Candidatus Hydrogenedentota bacterium]